MKPIILPIPWFELEIPIYGGRLIVYKNRKQIATVVRVVGATNDHDGKDVTGVFFPVTLRDGKSLYVIGWYDKTVSTLLHELLHCVLYILSSRNIDITKDEETACYILQYIFGKLTKEK